MKTNDQKIKQLRISRKAAGLTQKDLAKLAGLHHGTVTFYETERRNIPDEVYQHLIAICRKQLKINLKLAGL